MEVLLKRVGTKKVKVRVKAKARVKAKEKVKVKERKIMKEKMRTKNTSPKLKVTFQSQYSKEKEIFTRKKNIHLQ